MNLFQGIDINAMQFVGPIVVLALTMFICAFLSNVISKSWPSELSKFLLGIAIISSFFIWAYPLNMGFYDFFK